MLTGTQEKGARYRLLRFSGATQSETHSVGRNASPGSAGAGSVLECNLYHSLVAQTVKHLPAMQETWVQSLGWEDPLEKEMATHSSTLA